jgi:hypothetical protein
MTAFRKMLLVVGVLILAFFGYGFYASNTPDGKARAYERGTIELCWREQGRKSVAPADAREMARLCEGLEEAYRQKWNRDP